jgi:hypothetical protein
VFVFGPRSDKGGKVGYAREDRCDSHMFIVRPREMGAHARPGPVLGARYKSRADGIEADISHRGNEVALVCGGGAIAILEEMTIPASPCVDEAV